jgi:hypothetical protein
MTSFQRGERTARPSDAAGEYCRAVGEQLKKSGYNIRQMVGIVSGKELGW